VEALVIKCKYCKSQNLAISILCNECSKLLFNLKWWYFAFLFLSFTVAEYLICQLGLKWVGYIYLEFLLIGIIFLLLRNHSKIWVSLSFFFLASFFLILLKDYNNNITILPNITSSFIKLIIVIYLPVAYWFGFAKACREYKYSIIKGFPVFSFVLFIFINFLILINSLYLIVDVNLLSVITKNLYLREITLILTLIFSIYISLINALKRKIFQPKDIFTNATSVAKFNYKPKSNILITFLPIIKSIYIILSKIYIIIIDFIKELINILKRILEYLIKFLINFIFEFIYLIGHLIKILLKSMRYYLRLYVIPLFMFFIIAIISSNISNNIYQFIVLNDTFNLLIKLILYIFSLVFLVFITLWTVTEYSFKKVRDSYIFSATLFIFIIFIGSLLSSYVLYILSKFYEKSVFKAINIFQISGTILLTLSLIIIYAYSKLKKGSAK
jgi:hypothetical protein